MPPLHRIDVLGSGGKPGEVRYTFTDAEMRATIKELEKKGKRWKDPIQRYKGLGEMDSGQLRDTTMAIGSRQLRRITVKDAEAASGVFDLLMGSDVAPRKEFIIAGAGSLDRASLDV
jgi:DNA gyrase subunit B